MGSRTSRALIVKSQTEVCATVGGPGGIQTLTRSLQDFYAVVTSPAHDIFDCRLPIADCRFLIADWRLRRLNQSSIGNRKSKMILVAVGGVEPPTSRL